MTIPSPNIAQHLLGPLGVALAEQALAVVLVMPVGQQQVEAHHLHQRIVALSMLPGEVKQGHLQAQTTLSGQSLYLSRQRLVLREEEWKTAETCTE